MEIYFDQLFFVLSSNVKRLKSFYLEYLAFYSVMLPTLISLGTGRAGSDGEFSLEGWSSHLPNDTPN